MSRQSVRAVALLVVGGVTLALAACGPSAGTVSAGAPVSVTPTPTVTVTPTASDLPSSPPSPTKTAAEPDEPTKKPTTYSSKLAAQVCGPTPPDGGDIERAQRASPPWRATFCLYGFDNDVHAVVAKPAAVVRLLDGASKKSSGPCTLELSAPTALVLDYRGGAPLTVSVQSGGCWAFGSPDGGDENLFMSESGARYVHGLVAEAMGRA